MRGDVDTIKERLDIAEVVSGYIKLEKTGLSLKACCPFHKEKTPSFYVSPVRQSFYCFGCGAKGDIFSFIEEVEGLDFRGALKLLAERAGVEIEYRSRESKTEKDKILNALEEATKFFEKQLAGHDKALQYLVFRGINEETIRNWRIGYAPGPPASGWRSLYEHLQKLGHEREIILKAGLAKTSETSVSKEAYDVFRDRIIFPLADINGSIIAFSGRALDKATEPKYLNTPDTVLFTKSEVLYGLDQAKDQIRRKDYAVLVEGQVDLVLSHQSGVRNTVASSGTAFTHAHLERLKRFSSRIIIAFDGDLAGEKAAEKASLLGIALGLEVKVALLPPGLDPAEVVSKNPEEWKNLLRASLPAIEFFYNQIETREKDSRRLGQLVVKRILPMIKLIKSTIEQSHFIAMLGKRTGIKEEILWEDLKKVKVLSITDISVTSKESEQTVPEPEKLDRTRREQLEDRLAEIKMWQQELSESQTDKLILQKEEAELTDNLSSFLLHDNLNQLLLELSKAEKVKDNQSITKLTMMIHQLHGQMRALEEKKYYKI